MAHEEELQKIIKDFTRQLTKEENLRNRPLWVKASQVFELTIFTDKEKLRRARDNMQIIQKKEKGIWYDLNSVANEFKKQKIA